VSRDRRASDQNAPALATFYNGLSDEQKARFNTLGSSAGSTGY
jgi:hypothetical protein